MGKWEKWIMGTVLVIQGFIFNLSFSKCDFI